MSGRLKPGVVLGLWLLTAPTTSAVEAQTPKEAVLWGKLDKSVEAVAERLDGVLGLYVKDLKTGATLEVRADEVFPQASSIKLTMLYELYRQADEGKIDLSEIVQPPTPRVGGGGVLQELGPDVRMTWRDLAALMMGWSDNEATNVLIKRLGMASIQARMVGLGLKETKLRRNMMDLEAARRGDENVSTPREMGRLMELLHQGSGLKPSSAADLLKVASIPKSSPFRLPLPESLPVADKPGELEGVRCVSALVRLPARPYVATIMTTALRSEADGEAAIREISALLYATFDRLARSSAYGRLLE